MNDDILNEALEKLVIAVTENQKLKTENNKLKRKLFEEVVKHEQEKTKN